MSTQHITTLTGSIYELVTYDQPSVQEGVGTLQRLPARVPAADAGAPSQPLNRDEEPIRVLKAIGVEVGAKARFTLEALGEGPTTLRTTSVIQNIEEVHA